MGILNNEKYLKNKLECIGFQEEGGSNDERVTFFSVYEISLHI